MSNPICFFDNASTTRVCPSSLRAVMGAMDIDYGNPSSVHSMGIAAENLVEQARKTVAQALGCTTKELIFTSGGTESNNLALIGGANLLARRGRHIISTSIEHPSVLSVLKQLEGNGYTVTYLDTSGDDQSILNNLSNAITDQTSLLTMMLVNNETGRLLPVTEASKLFKERVPDGLVHTDAVQAFLKFPLTVSRLAVDLLSISAHKVHGPKGVGGLYIRNGIKLKPLILGGNQEGGLRSGTESVPLIAGFGAAVSAAHGSLNKNIDVVESLTQRFISGLAEIKGITPISEGIAIVNFALPKYPSEVTIRMLESKNIFVSGGSACSRGKKSHVLTALGLAPSIINSAIRVSFSWTNTPEEVDRLLDALSQIATSK